MPYKRNPLLHLGFDYYLGGNTIRPAQWDDLKFPAVAQNLTSPAGRIDYNFDELTVDFASNAVYPDDELVAVGQFPHSWKKESGIRPHVHWLQEQNAVPNWLLVYRVYPNGGVIPAFQHLPLTNTALTPYPGHPTINISFSDIIDLSANGPWGSLDQLSSVMDFKIFRDTANTTGLFPGPDLYTGDAKLKEFDVHYQSDSSGSTEELVK
jgi:hypothetical protein